MKSWCKNLLAAGLSLAMLSACSSSDVEDEPVSELTAIQATVFPEVSWSASVGDGVGDYYSRLAPAVRYGKSLLPIVMAKSPRLMKRLASAFGLKISAKNFVITR